MNSFFSGVTKIFLLIAACFFVTLSRAQEAVVNENNAPSLKWYQLNTTHFRILYPLGYEQQAQRMANTLEYVHEPEAKTMGASPRKISIILQNQNSISNGFVSITPRRSEFFGMPSQNYNFIGNNDWLNLLATHEYRHIVQYQHATRGFNRLVYYGFGNFGLSAMAYLGAPQWFWEGDAVATETAFTNSGRGRIPNFELLFRTNLMEGRTFNYHKQYLRSYKHNIPDHYKLGYHMVSYLRRKTKNPEVWENVTRRSWNTSFIPFTFSVALKKETGLYVRDLYNEMAADLKKQWQAQLDTTRLTPFFTVNTRTNNAYTDYRFPQEMEGGRILVQKSGIGDIEQLVLLDGNHETTIYTQGAINDAAMLSATNSRVVWNEHRFDPRWRMKTYSAIVGYDMGSKTKTVIAKNGRYAAAAISSDGYQIATVETSTDYQTKLVVLDYLSGKRVLEFKNPDNDFISMPRWTPDGKQIVALKTNKKGKALVSFSLENKEEKLLTEFSDENMGHPVPFGKYVLYNSPISGIDNIYALDTETGKRYQITSSKYGSYNPSLSRDGKIIYYNEQGKDGLDVVKINFNPSEWKEWNLRTQPSALFAHLAEQEASHHFLSGIPDSTYKAKRYSRLKGIVNPYTWGAYVNNDLTSIFAGITSRDLLSTTTISGGYQYDLSEQTSAWKGMISYQALYPIIDFSFTKSNRQVNEGTVPIDVINATNTTSDTTTIFRTLIYKWEEQSIEAGIRIPLVATTSKFIRNFTFGNSVGATQVNNFRNSITGSSRIIPSVVRNDTIIYYNPSFFVYQGNGNLVYNHFSLSAYRILKQSRRDFNPKWGQAVFVHSYSTPFSGAYTGSQFSIYALLYFPGLFKHHSFWGYGAYQSRNMSLNQSRENYQFRNRIPLPRGIPVSSTYQNFYSFSGNYALPVLYPDINIGPLLNFQRVRLNAFFDYGYGSGFFGNQFTSQYISTGAEVKFDINVMRLLPQLDIGFRYSYGIKPSTSLFEILIGTFNL